jgi:hypothetical protein
MGFNALPALPSPPTGNDAAVVGDYVRRLYSVLTQWQTILANTNFLGGKGYLTISDDAPSSSDGNDDDIWIEW